MTISNLTRYQSDLDRLIVDANKVKRSLLHEAFKDDYKRILLDKHDGDAAKVEADLAELKAFRRIYQHWYSEAVPLIRQMLPDRLNDFTRLYEKPKSRKEIDYESYRIEDACQGLQTTLRGQVKADMRSALPLLEQQIAIVETIRTRFTSSLFDIKQLLQYDLYDSELDTAKGLLKVGFARAAGAIAGVVLEGHLKHVCEKHNIPKKAGTISILNDGLKAADVIELSQYRQIQFLGDVRNKCGHKNSTDPTAEEVSDMIAGVDKVIKTVF